MAEAAGNPVFRWNMRWHTLDSEIRPFNPTPLKDVGIAGKHLCNFFLKNSCRTGKHNGTEGRKSMKIAPKKSLKENDDFASFFPATDVVAPAAFAVAAGAARKTDRKSGG